MHKKEEKNVQNLICESGMLLFFISGLQLKHGSRCEMRPAVTYMKMAYFRQIKHNYDYVKVITHHNKHNCVCYVQFLTVCNYKPYTLDL